MQKVFIYEYSNFFTVAKDVKVQVAFNSENIKAYRLIGYENRLLNQEDFTNDTIDAGEIGANQNITALYEIVPKNNTNYKSIPTFTIKFRYKNPDADNSIPLDLESFDEGKAFEESSDYTKFMSGVAAFSMLITDSQYKGSSSFDKVLNWINNVSLRDVYNFKSEFRVLVNKEKTLY